MRKKKKGIKEQVRSGEILDNNNEAGPDPAAASKEEVKDAPKQTSDPG